MKLYNVGNRIMNKYIYKIDERYIMIDTGYEGSLNKVIKKVFYNKKENEEMGENAYKAFYENYTDIENYENLKEIYEQYHTVHIKEEIIDFDIKIIRW